MSKPHTGPLHKTAPAPCGALELPLCCAALQSRSTQRHNPGAYVSVKVVDTIAPVSSLIGTSSAMAVACGQRARWRQCSSQSLLHAAMYPAACRRRRPPRHNTLVTVLCSSHSCSTVVTHPNSKVRRRGSLLRLSSGAAGGLATAGSHGGSGEPVRGCRGANFNQEGLGCQGGGCSCMPAWAWQ